MWVRLVLAVAIVGMTIGGVVVTQAQVAAPPQATGSPTERAGALPQTATEPPVIVTAPPSTEAVASEPTATTTPVPPASPAPTATTAPGPPRLVRRLERLVARTDIAGTEAITVVDSAGTLLFAHRANREVLPASTQKLPVAAAALARLGADFRYTTTVRSTIAPGPNGVIEGDLVLVGSGDPALASPEFALLAPERPRTPLEALARRIKQAGVRKVNGRIIADPSVFAAEPTAVGWLPRYFEGLDATRISGLTVDAGRRVYRSGGGLRAEAADDPAAQAGRQLRRQLRRIGVRVRGGTRTAASPSQVVDIASITSPPLGDLLRYMVQRSDNHLADTIFRTIGAAEGDSTWIGAAGATAKILAPLNLDWSGVVLADGSGLSRANRVSPGFLVQLQTRMWSSSLSDQWIDLLAVSARSGTLRYRLRDGVAAGRVYGKTGSLRDVTALVGTVVGPQTARWHFAVIGNGLTSTSAMRTLTDRAVEVMAQELYECRRQRPPGKTAKGKPKPKRLVCAAPTG